MNTCIRTVQTYDELTLEDLSSLHRAADNLREDRQKYNPTFKFSKNSYKELRGHIRHYSHVDIPEDIIAQAIKRLREKENACVYRERQRERERQEMQALKQVSSEYFSEQDRLVQQDGRVEQLKRETKDLKRWIELAQEDAQKQWEEMRAREQELKNQASIEPPSVSSPECNSFAIHMIFTLIPSFLAAIKKGKRELLGLLETIIREIAYEWTNNPNDWQESLSEEQKTKLFVNVSAPVRKTVTYGKGIEGFLFFVRDIWTHRARFGWLDDYHLCDDLQVLFPWFLPAWVKFMSRANPKVMNRFESTRAYLKYMLDLYGQMADEKRRRLEGKNPVIDSPNDM